MNSCSRYGKPADSRRLGLGYGLGARWGARLVCDSPYAGSIWTITAPVYTPTELHTLQHSSRSLAHYVQSTAIALR
jgi:hypothetical protein